jgi:NAD+ kinase
MPGIETIGLFSKPGSEKAAELVPALVAWLTARGLKLRLDPITAAYAGRGDGLPHDQVPSGCDLIIVLGGDGTLLSAAHSAGASEVPLFAVNLGGLGFLTTIAPDDIYADLESALRGELRIGRRRMLHCDLVRAGRTMIACEALNDVVLNKSQIARMIDLETHVDARFVCRFKADGAIISTPTGSTAYSLSAGGPIVFPSVACLCLTPICPHMLTNRPVILPDSSVISIRNRSEDGGAYLTIDGQIGEPLQRDDLVVCRSSSYVVRLVRPPNQKFFDVLRAKLKWGEQ